jgi:hypothetical protein
MDKFAEYVQTNIYPKLLDILYVIRVYLCLLFDNFKLFQYKFKFTSYGTEPKKCYVSEGDLFKNLDSVLYKNHGIELNYGAMFTKRISLNINDSVQNVCVILGALNPGYVTNIARNLPKIRFNVYTSNKLMRDFIDRRNYDNIFTYDCSEFNNESKYDRILIGPKILTTNLPNYISIFQKCLNENGKMILQTVSNFSTSNRKSDTLIRNSLTFNSFFDNREEKKDDYIIPSFNLMMNYMSKVSYIVPLWAFKRDADVLKSTFSKNTKEYDLLFRMSRFMKLYGEKYYLTTYEYFN